MRKLITDQLKYWLIDMLIQLPADRVSFIWPFLPKDRGLKLLVEIQVVDIVKNLFIMPKSQQRIQFKLLQEEKFKE